MSYTSFIYLLLVTLTFICYYAVPVKCRWIVLLLANMVFYLSAGSTEFVILLVAVVASYFAGRSMGRYNEMIRALKNDESLDKVQRKQKRRIQ